MLRSIFAFCLVALFMSACNNSSKKDLKLYMCSCKEIPNLGDSTQVVERIQYSYIVSSERLPDCCSASANRDYPGYKEVWKNSAPEKPTVWGRQSTDLTKIDAREAQSLGCSMNMKNISIVAIEDNSITIRDLYPDLYQE